MNMSVAAKIRQSFAKQSLMATLGARIELIEPGRVVIAAPIAPPVLQQHGFAHAGLSFAIGDSAAGYAALSLMGRDDEVLTAEMKINLLAPGAGERLEATGGVIKSGRRLIVVGAVVEAVFGAERKEIAILQGTMVPVTGSGTG